MAFGDGPTLLSAFTGADENPLSEGGNWAALDTAAAGRLQRISNQVGCTQTTTRDAYWTPANFGPNCEVYLTIPTKPATGNSIVIVARVQGEGGVTTWDGYAAQFAEVTGAGNDTWQLSVVTNGTFTSLASGTREFTAGEKIGIQCFGDRISIWVFAGGSWTELGSGTDATYSAAGKVGMRIRGTTGRIDDFFAGAVVITEAATVPLTLTPGTGYVDDEIVELVMTPLGGECYSTFSAVMFGEGEANVRWLPSGDNTRWSGVDSLRWSVGEVMVEGINC